jgi:hypothetical protein
MRIFTVIVAGMLCLPATALAGAPNYDCALNDGVGRLAIDQWRPKVVAVGIGAVSTRGGAPHEIEQNGPTLGFRTTLAGVPWRVEIADYGRSLTMTSATSRRSGTCTFIPGTFILRVADRGGHVVRAAPSAQAAERSAIRTGGPVWERPDLSPRGRWLAVRVVVAKRMGMASKDGWLRQSGRFQTRGSSGSG